MSAQPDPEAIKPLLRDLGQGPTAGRSLTRQEARYCLDLILDGVATPAQAGAFLLLQRYKGETPDELLGFVDAVRGRPSTRTIKPDVEGLLDVGSPYDGRVKTVSVSVPASLIAAAAGVPVLLHGEPGVPPKHGYTIADVLAVLGVSTEHQPAQVEKQIETLGIGYLRQAHFAPDLVALKSLREELALRTPLNMVEKIYDIASAPFHLVGLTHVPYLPKLLGALVGMGFRKTALVHGMEGNEDLPSNRGVRVIESLPTTETEALSEYRVNATDLGLATVSAEELGGSPTAEASAQLAEQVVLNQVAQPWRDLVLLNAGFRIYLAGRAPDIMDGVAKAKSRLESGEAAALLQAWRSED